jgi:hypothetical protein
MSNIRGAIELIIDERVRQVNAEGFTAVHDDAHTDGELAAVASCCAEPPYLRFP